ncbi:DUF262 and DUF1524 domain-containing protein [Phytoactinopolyspora endophytica]|uniref:DUF262 and DUF1524 domain-containing protein n=1 Tax=Phytoactinopolyspora endophytica TaxID=1642495 RepID=UPI00101D657D|nr:DUF262 and DUF1524 domain-containing protein [Phytoactinopolyspora endophytica]
MKASETKLLDLLAKGSQFVIPIYQRTYSWTEDECSQLWSDIVRAGSDDELNAHFIGSIVHVEKGLSNLTSQEPNLVIDGQQRLTTVSLVVAALAEVLGNVPDGEREPLDGFSPKKLRNRYLVNNDEEGDRFYKLLLSQTDKDTLMAIVSRAELPRDSSERVETNFAFFRSRLVQPDVDLGVVCRGLAKLVVVDIRLDRTHDSPQLIFESMNSTGRKLSQADLIRNFVLMGLEPSAQERLYKQYWRPMEVDFGQAAYESQFDEFVRHYLTVVTGEIPRLRDIYDAFKAYAGRLNSDGHSVERLVNELRDYSRRYCAVALGHEENPELAAAFQDLREIRADVVYPFLLELYTDYDQEILTAAELSQIVQIVTSYIFRRAVCRIPTNSLNTTFSTFTRYIRKDRYVDFVTAHFLSMRSYRAFPTDEEFGNALRTNDLYNFKRRSYFLRRMENHGRKETVSIEDYTIEHILPQNDNLSQHWRDALGDDWEETQARYLHTLGNLTLTGYNAEYSDHPFPKKRDMEGGFKDSPLRLNRGLGTIEQWNAAAIEERGARLAAEAIKIWPRPSLSTVERSELREPRLQTAYSIEDHSYLLSPTRRALFEKFRAEVLAFDPSVTEEFLKNYVAYKAVTNFVDVVPQVARLRLSLNMPFDALHDDRHEAWDVTGRGQWGNGDAQVGLAENTDFSYVIGLVRQAYEYQIGE